MYVLWGPLLAHQKSGQVLKWSFIVAVNVVEALQDFWQMKQSRGANLKNGTHFIYLCLMKIIHTCKYGRLWQPVYLSFGYWRLFK